ncbi:ABC transporter permease [Stieleria sp. TO1_6]|nr:ABC transporter permease [Stieleria tagensis]
MGPYLAVIVDSFRSALASRILWIAFVAIWIFLAALAPIGYHEDYTTTFRWFDLDNGTQMKAMLARGLVDPAEADTALGRISRTFPADINRKLRQVAKGEDVRIDKDALADSLNQSMDDEQWYDAQAWKSTVRLSELRELDEIPDDKIDDSLRRRRARLRIEAALPGVFAAQSARSITLSYAGFDFPAIFLIGKTQFVALVNQFVVPIMMDWLLGFALIFLGILVTASIIPDMLQPGSLHLLLSKPISRTLLLLAKFIGGCAFVFLCVCQLVIGLWLIAGWRLDIWNVRILWCIPVAVFLFAVFFSVSTLAGLRWRSPILSIGVTCMFGAFVMVIGFIGGYFDGLVRGPDRISHMAFDGDQVVVATRGGELKQFDQDSNQWIKLIEGDFRRRDLIVPPIRIGDDTIATAKIRNGRFNLYGSGSLDLLLLDGTQDWKPNPGLRLPNGTRRMFAIGDALVVLNNTGLMATEIEQAAMASGIETSEDDAQEETQTSSGSDGESDDQPPASIGVTAWISDLIRMQGGATEDFVAILPQSVTLTEPVRVAPLSPQRDLIIYSRGRLLRLTVPANLFDHSNSDSPSESQQQAVVAADVLLEDDNASRTVLAAAGESVLLARQGEPIRWIDAMDLNLVAEFAVPDDQAVISMIGLGDSDRFAILTSDGRVHLAMMDADGVELQSLEIAEANAIEFDPQQNQLAVAHHIDAIDFWDLTHRPDRNLSGPAPTLSRKIRPTLTSWRSIDRYLVTPLRTMTPQTGELSQMVAALVSGKSSFAIGGESDEEQEVVQLKIARPVVSCSVFILVMLTLSCVYFSRRDF